MSQIQPESGHLGAQPTTPNAMAMPRQASTAAPQASTAANKVRRRSAPAMGGAKAKTTQNATSGLSRFRYMPNGTASAVSGAGAITSGL
ncbi:hypothetical protein D3C73_1407930 [compost metagenome]